MGYQIIRPPFTLVFREMDKKDLLAYNKWFHEVLPERLQTLSTTVQSTPGYEQWIPDYSPHSLGGLGDWFFTNVEARPRTEEEIERLQSKFGVPQDELTDRTFSLAMDIGMYLSQTLLKNHPSLQWSQPFGNKRFIDYGQPVLVGFTTGLFNPVGTMITLAYGFNIKSRTGGRLREIYDKLSSDVK